MRTHQLLALSGLMLMSNIASAAELDRDDVPNRCWDVCGPVVGIAHKCDGTIHDNDRAEMKCICDWKQAPSLIPLCEACIAQSRSERYSNRNRDDDDDDDDDDDHRPHDNDAYDILTSCSLSTTSWNAAAATSALSSASTTGTSSGATSTNTSSSTNGGSSTSGGSDSSNNNSNGNSADSVSNTDTAASAQTTDNAAPGTSAPMAATMAAVVGLSFLAWL